MFAEGAGGLGHGPRSSVDLRYDQHGAPNASQLHPCKHAHVSLGMRLQLTKVTFPDRPSLAEHGTVSFKCVLPAETCFQRDLADVAWPFEKPL